MTTEAVAVRKAQAMAATALKNANEALQTVGRHEKECAERYASIQEQLKTLPGLINVVDDIRGLMNSVVTMYKFFRGLGVLVISIGMFSGAVIGIHELLQFAGVL